MNNKKDLIIAMLATFCLTASIFAVLPTQSAYDPWLDYNEDGYIGIDDVFSTASEFGAEGDPTKNVNVTNWPESWLQESSEVRLVFNSSFGYIPPDPNHYYHFANIDLTGYKNMYIHARAQGTWQDHSDPSLQTKIYIVMFWSTCGIETNGGTFPLYTGSPGSLYRGTGTWSGTINSTSLSLYLRVYDYEADITLLTVAVYLTN